MKAFDKFLVGAGMFMAALGGINAGALKGDVRARDAAKVTTNGTMKSLFSSSAEQIVGKDMTPSEKQEHSASMMLFAGGIAVAAFGGRKQLFGAFQENVHQIFTPGADEATLVNLDNIHEQPKTRTQKVTTAVFGI